MVENYKRPWDGGLSDAELAQLPQEIRKRVIEARAEARELERAVRRGFATIEDRRYAR